MSQMRYSEKLRDAIDELRPAFKEVGIGLASLTQKRTELAPVFMRAYVLWQRETKKTSMVAFAQVLDPAMPGDRAQYRTHPSYRAAEYLKQLAAGDDKKGPKGLTPLAMLAVTIKSFLPLIGSQKEQMEALQTLVAATRWRDGEQRRLLAKIRRARPVSLPKTPRLIDARTTKQVVVAFERERRTA